MTSTTVHQEETRRSNHEAQKQQVDQRGRSFICQIPTNPSHQGSSRKFGRIQHHLDQDSPRSGVSHIQYLQSKSSNIQKLQTIRVLTDDEVLKDRNGQDGKYFYYRENSIPAYGAMWGSSEIIRRHCKSIWQ